MSGRRILHRPRNHHQRVLDPVRVKLRVDSSASIPVAFHHPRSQINDGVQTHYELTRQSHPASRVGPSDLGRTYTRRASRLARTGNTVDVRQGYSRVILTGSWPFNSMITSSLLDRMTEPLEYGISIRARHYEFSKAMRAGLGLCSSTATAASS